MPRHEDIWGSRRIAPLILNLRTGWEWVVSYTPRHCTPRESASIEFEIDWLGLRASLNILGQIETRVSAGNRTEIPPSLARSLYPRHYCVMTLDFIHPEQLWTVGYLTRRPKCAFCLFDSVRFTKNKMLYGLKYTSQLFFTIAYVRFSCDDTQENIFMI